ncbi:uncharacterized protein LOC142625370 [Castanea sativa]|uniref:uncharacterized protein LOC142625370 n=1 Tax=Castanea sativa TaxID=21020 RepID=UPI003F651BA6
MANSFNLFTIKILVLNCKGAGNQNFKRTFVDLTQAHHPDIAVVMETRISGQRVEEVSALLGFDNVCYFDATGFQDGIWVLWIDNNISLNVLSVNEQVINTFVQVCPANPSNPWLFITIYASPDLSKCLSLWTELEAFNPYPHHPWLLAGDFNKIVAHHENLSCTPPNQRRISLFSNFINSCNLLDLGFNGPKFT